jgi:hypothetical protein
MKIEDLVNQLGGSVDRCKKIQQYVALNPEAFEMLRACNLYVLGTDYALYCHPLPDMGEAFCRMLCPEGWMRQPITPEGSRDWQCRPENCPCVLHVFGVEYDEIEREVRL